MIMMDPPPNEMSENKLDAMENAAPIPARKPSFVVRTTTTRRAPRTLKICELEAGIAARLQQLDLNNDGEIDATELVAAVQMLVEEQRRTKYLTLTTIGTLVTMVLLIGCLTGMTFGVVKLAAETKVTNNQFLVTKANLPVVSGGAVLSLFGEHKLSDASLVYQSVTGVTGRRRSMMDTSGTYSSTGSNTTMSYLTSINATTVWGACSFIQQGLASFTARAILPNDTNLMTGGQGTSHSTIVVHWVTGCDQGNQDVNSISAIADWTVMGRTFALEVHCAEGVCVAWYDAGNMQASSGSGRHLLADSWGGDASGCFPAHSSVEVLGRGVTTMEQLQYGDKVASVDRATGALAWSEVFLFAHRDASTWINFVKLDTVKASITMSEFHFLPICVDGCDSISPSMRYKYAVDVVVGDMVWVSPSVGVSVELATVTRVSTQFSRGLYDPIIRGADLIVDGVVASPYARWIFASLLPDSMQHWLPFIYEVISTPLPVLYALLGRGPTEWLAHGPPEMVVNIRDNGLCGFMLYLSFVGSFMAPFGLAAWRLTATSGKF